MINFLYTYQSLFDHILVYSLFAMSQYVVLRAGVFSLGSAGFAALGAYGTALLITKAGWNPVLAIAAGTVRPDEAGDLSRRDLQADLVDGWHAAEMPGHILKNQRRGHWSTSVLRTAVRACLGRPGAALMRALLRRSTN